MIAAPLVVANLALLAVLIFVIARGCLDRTQANP
jgi:hypothetical protein